MSSRENRVGRAVATNYGTTSVFVDAFACSSSGGNVTSQRCEARLVGQHALVFSSFFLFAQSVIAVTDSLSVPPYLATVTSDLRPGGGHGTETS